MGFIKWWWRESRPRAARAPLSDKAMLDRLEQIVAAGERVALDHGEGNGFLAGSPAGASVGPSLRAALTEFVAYPS